MKFSVTSYKTMLASSQHLHCLLITKKLSTSKYLNFGLPLASDHGVISQHAHVSLIILFPEYSVNNHHLSGSASTNTNSSRSGSGSGSGSVSGSGSNDVVGVGVGGALDVESDGTEHECLGKHLFVLVHGYQGNSWDMRMFRNRLLVKCPDDVFLMSECNEKESLTEGDIAEMGSRLAAEIVSFIDLHILSQRQALCRMSFITHSLGGIIAREALSNRILKPYLSRCHTFISLAVCHCGYLFGRSKALQAGFWVMRSWKKSLCLSQLSLTDHENPRKTYLYKLSEKPALKWFENVLLVSSPEDRYVHFVQILKVFGKC